jgi:hypothetical protein
MIITIVSARWHEDPLFFGHGSAAVQLRPLAMREYQSTR